MLWFIHYMISRGVLGVDQFCHHDLIHDELFSRDSGVGMKAVSIVVRWTGEELSVFN